MNVSYQTRANLILLLGSVIWGFAFVAQRTGMQFVGPFTFNGVRFAIGGLVLIPLILYLDGQRKRSNLPVTPIRNRSLLLGGLLAGIFLFGGASLQQAGLVYTSAGKAGFITSLYVILVPIMGLAFGQRTAAGTWIGALLAITGLYLLSIQGDLSVQIGDILVLLGAFVWAGHVLLMGRLSPGMDPVKLSAVQFLVCAALSLFAAVLVETISLSGIQQAMIPILYAGVLSVGVGYTFQVIGQRYAQPAHAAIIMSLESVFAVLGGWLLLDEQIGLRGLIGCAFMLTGILISQLYGQHEVVVDGAAA
ncbi:MAG: DMT family transporter [Chloroflexota bacterium]